MVVGPSLSLRKPKVTLLSVRLAQNSAVGARGSLS